MAAEQGKGQPAGDLNRQKKLAVLVPIAGVALIAVLVIVIVSVSDTSPAKGQEKKMPADGSNGEIEDPDLKSLNGIQYRDLREGDGPEVPPGATVTLHYVGWLQDAKDGTYKVFDSSRERGEPSTFGLGGLIRGWQIGIPGMRVGGIRKLVIPSDLGYGAQTKGKIPGNSTLVFEVEVLGVQ